MNGGLFGNFYSAVADVVQLKVHDVVVSTVLALITPAQSMLLEVDALVIVTEVPLVENGDGTPLNARLLV